VQLLLDMKFRFGINVDGVLPTRLAAFADKIINAVAKNKKSSKVLESINSLMPTLIDDSAKKGRLFLCS